MSSDLTPVEGCTVCEVVAGGEAAETVFQTDLFTVSLSARYPFGLVICTKRHSQGLADMTPEEAAEFGQIAARTAAEMRKEWTPWVYLTAFGEEAPHFHGMLHAQYQPISEAFHTRLYVQVEEMEPHAEEARELGRAVGSRLTAAWPS